MKNKKNLIFGMFLLVGIFLIGGVLGQVSYCCEKVTDGAWCQNAEQDQCDTQFLSSPTECASTSYCALGTCVNKRDGECMENTPARNCDSQNGFWSKEKPENLPQCQLGCCLIGDQAAFVTQTKCKGFASLYGIDTNFQSNIQNEIQCIASAFPDVKGACVFEQEFDTTCRMTTRSECNAISEAGFHEGFLCTADELATNCAPTKKTTCVDGRDEVFFTDSCGNVANVYDSSTLKPDSEQAVPDGEDGELYWTYITASGCSDLGIGNAGSTSCGNCDYFEGSTCKEYNRNMDDTAPDYGDYICRGLGCEFDTDGNGEIDKFTETFLHGETWCAQTDGTDFLDIIDGEISTDSSSSDNTQTNLPGSRYFRLVCYNSEVTVEPCEDNRAEVCIQSERDYTIEGVDKTFKSALCRVNVWQDCVTQTNETDCTDTSIRDCQWITETIGDDETLQKCVPIIAPGFDFATEEEGIGEEATAICSLASTSCTAHYEKSLADDLTNTGTKQIDGDECFDGGKDYVPAWGEAQNKYCASLGDCQGKLSGDEGKAVIEKIKNYLGFS